MTGGSASSASEVQIVPRADGSGWTLTSQQWLPRPREEVFAFYADAFQLEEITPPWLKFRVLTAAPIEIRRGTLIEYRLKLRGIPLGWRSEITVCEPPFRFVDEQRKGPYSLWRHEHLFAEQSDGTLCCDHVDYNLLCGRIVNGSLVAPDLRRIFEYRHRRLQELLGQPRGPMGPV